MKRLKIVLQSNIFYIINIIIILFIIIFITKLKTYNSIYQDGNNTLICKVKTVKYDSNKISLDLKCNENIKGYYYLENNNITIMYGDIITINGEINTPNNNTIPNTFNYKKYLYNNKIYKIITINKFINIKHSNNLFVKLKQYIYNKCNNKYLALFITGNKSLLEDNIYTSYQNIGVAHLLAISGMHIAVLIKILKKLFKYIPVNISNILIIIILIYYLYIVNYSVSVIRVILFFIINLINKQYNLELNNIKILLLTCFILLIYNPFYIYNLSFKYSFLASLGVILSSKYNSNNYIKNLLIISLFTLLLTLPITINLNYEINLILFISNLILIPLVTFIIFPLSLCTLIFPFIINIYVFITSIMEYIVNILSSINIFTIIIPKLTIIFIIIYYLIIFIFIKTDYKRYLLLIILLFIIHIGINYFNNSLNVTCFDVKQGDSISIIFPHNKAILIDTGSNLYSNNLKNIMLYLKSKGISNIQFLVLTHGDNDHMGDAINLINNFKINNVILNCGTFNDLENNLTKVLNQKKIKYYSCIKELTEYQLIFLNTGTYEEENDNSIVVYLKYQDYKFLFMGDASVEREEDILEKYNLSNIDFLKVGHHGSDTSSSQYFIKSIQPKYSIISVGLNNRYGHPKDSVLNVLNRYNSEIYRTDIDGSIEIKIKRDGYSIETCEP